MDCCGNGCVDCVWTIYDKELREWTEAQALKEAQADSPAHQQQQQPPNQPPVAEVTSEAQPLAKPTEHSTPPSADEKVMQKK